MNNICISFVDVGQGDCTLAVDKEAGSGLLIDCPSGKDAKAVDEINQLGCMFITAAIVTHTHADHAGGLLDVLESLADRFIGNVYVNPDRFIRSSHPERTNQLRSMYNRLREYGSRAQPAYRGTHGEAGMITWRLLAPEHHDVFGALADSDPNVASAVVLISADGQHAVVGGDALLEVWQRIAGEIPEGATVRWPHHGGSVGGDDRRLAQERLFEITRPSTVIITVGSTNQHGHPMSAFFEARKNNGAVLMCTEATASCVRDGGVGGRCAGTIRLMPAREGNRFETDAADHAAIIDAYGLGQCRDMDTGASSADREVSNQDTSIPQQRCSSRDESAVRSE